MHCLEIIIKMNNENYNQEHRTDKLEFDKTAGCLVYKPSRVNNPERKNSQAIQSSKNKRGTYGSF